jgi:hypothetical protein
MGESMSEVGVPARAYFLSSTGEFLPDTLVCSGYAKTILEREECSFSENGRLPLPMPVSNHSVLDFPGIESPNDLWPACAVARMGSLEQWQDAAGGGVPKALLGLRVFKCTQMLLFVVPGLEDDRPERIDMRTQASHDRLLRRTYGLWGRLQVPSNSFSF